MRLTDAPARGASALDPGINSIMVGEMGPFDALVERLAGT